jgi:arginyl-tRNA synthetase
LETIAAILEGKLRAATAGLTAESPQVTPATDPRFGDYQSNVAMVVAKQQKTNPRALAAEIAAKFDPADVTEPPEIAGAGFLNFRLRPEFVASRLATMAADERLGVSLASPQRTIVIDFSSPNVAKPMHVGHIRSTILGDTLARTAEFLGHNVIRDNHIGDWGTQFGKVIWGWKHLLDRDALDREPIGELVRLYKEANARAEADPEVLAACRDELIRLQAGDPENLKVWQECTVRSWGEFQQIYERLGVRFDEHLGESSYNDALAPLVERLIQQRVAEESEGAICIFFREDPALADKPCLIRKSDGGFNYATTDLATIEYRIGRWKPDAIWYVVGAPQQLHFQQIFKAAERMGVRTELRHVAFGSILGEDRRLMKTRSGENVGLRDLLDEAHARARQVLETKNAQLNSDEAEAIAEIIGIGAIKYADLSQYRLTDYVFAWDKMLSLQGNTAPYLQNAYVRIQSIFRKAEGDIPSGATFVFTDPAELSLAKKLAQFSETVPAVLDDFRPNILTNYLYELANSFHGFYEACPVLKAAEPARSSRLALCRVTAQTIQCGLSLLGIDVPERM